MDNRVAPRGYAPYPRYFSVHFTVLRRRNKQILRPEDPDKAPLMARARQLREEGMSYPAIAHALGTSVGTAWNLVNQ